MGTKYGNQHHRRRYHCEKYLPRAHHGSGAGAQTLGLMVLDVLQDHDGIVHDQPCCENEREQCQDIDGESE